eukprot:tig00021037_g17474.t1
MAPSDRGAGSERPADRSACSDAAAPGGGEDAREPTAKRMEARQLAGAPWLLCLAALASAAAPEIFAKALWYRLTDAAGTIGGRKRFAPAAAALCHLSRLGGCGAGAPGAPPAPPAPRTLPSHPSAHYAGPLRGRLCRRRGRLRRHGPPVRRART